jgi:DNA polymerase III delta subunit
MIYYFYGKERFLNQKKAQEYTEKYKNKYPASLGFYSFGAENFLPDEMEGAVKTLSMFGENKLIILQSVQDFSSENLDKIASLVKENDLINHKNIFLIFTSENATEEDLSKKHDFFKILENLPQSSNLSQSSKQSTDLSPIKLRAFIEDEADKLGLKLNTKLVSLLLQSNADISTIANNLQILSNFQAQINRPIDEKDFADLIEDQIVLDENSIFRSIDAITSGKADQALDIFYALLQKDDKAIFNIWGMLGYFLRNLIIVRSLLDEGNKKENIIKKSGLKPFVVQKYMEFSKNLKMDQILKLHTLLTDLDIKIKTGQIDGVTALELFVSKVSSVLKKQ